MAKKSDRKKLPRLPRVKSKLTFEQRAADRLTSFVGSWKFIITLLIFIFFWVMINVHMIIYRWDPYPFILLNFVLSCLAALQAPVILMSQNRTAERDRAMQKYDYKVDRQAARGIKQIIKDLEAIKRKIK